MDQQDAYATARWMAGMDSQGALAGYFSPPLTVGERAVADEVLVAADDEEPRLPAERDGSAVGDGPSLRPRDLDEFVGQAELKARLRIILEAARRRGQAVDHLLFAGPPGLGKTTLAHILARAFGSEIHLTSGPQIEKAGDLAGILTNVQHGDFLFIDEIHRLHPAIE